MRLILALSVLPLLLMLVYRYPKMVLWSYPLVALFTVFNPFYFIRAGGFFLLPMDGIYFLIAAYLGIHILRRPKEVTAALKENPFLTLFLAVVAIYVVIYTPVYGQSAIGEARKFYGVFLFPLFALVLLKKPEDFHRFLQVIVVTAAVVAVAGVMRIGAEGSFVRAVNAPGTLIIALAAFALIVLRMNRVVLFHGTADKILLVVFAALALGSAQRSVWLAVGAGSLFLVWLQYGRPMLMAKIAVLALALFVASATSLVYFPDVGGRLLEKFAGIINPMEDHTASWRIEGWQQQLEQLREGNLLFGEGLGSYYSWQWGSIEVTFSPHNAYIQTALKFGLFGLAIYVLLAIRFFRTTLAVRRRLPPGPMRAYLEAGILGFGAAHGYMMGYAFEPIILIFFAVAMSAAKVSREALVRFRAAQAQAARVEPDISPAAVYTQGERPGGRPVEIGTSGTVRGSMFGVRR
jgi:O-antigen ligase